MGCWEQQRRLADHCHTEGLSACVLQMNGSSCCHLWDVKPASQRCWWGPVLWLLLVSVRSLVSFSLDGHKFQKQAKNPNKQRKGKQLEGIITQDFQLKKTLLTCKLSQIKSCYVLRASSSEILSNALGPKPWEHQVPSNSSQAKRHFSLTFSILRKNTTAF